MKHNKQVETTHELELTAADLRALLNKPPRNVQVPDGAKFTLRDGTTGESFDIDQDRNIRVTWKENGK